MYIDELGNGDRLARARIMDSTGGFITGFEITGDDIEHVRVAALANGNWVATWETGGSNRDIYHEVFSPTGASLHGPFLTVGGADNTIDPRIAALPDGGFAIVWQNSSAFTIRGRLYNAVGGSDGSTFTVRDPDRIGGFPGDPAIGVTGDGRLLISFDENSEDLSEDDQNIFAQIRDGRRATIDASDYEGSSNFVDGNVIATRLTSTNVNGGDDANLILAQGGDDTLTGGLGGDTIRGRDGEV